MSLIFSSLYTYFSPLIPPIINQDDTFYDLSCLLSYELHTHRGTHITLSLISVYFFARTQTELWMGHMIVTWRGRGSGSQGSHHFPSAKGVPLFNMWQALVHLAPKGRRYSEWFELCCVPNTPMTNGPR